MNAGACRNCEATLAGRWCHACGQDSRDPLRDHAQLVGEFLDNVFGWDSRLARTLRLLFGAPGALTSAFVAGRRAAYLGPLRLYLIASVLFFATYALTPDPVMNNIAGFGDADAGAARIAYIARWLPTLMILILPSLALFMLLAYRNTGRGFVEHLVFVLHFGALAFLTLTVGQLVALVLRALGAGSVSTGIVIAAHALNASYLFLMALRHYGLGLRETVLRILGVCLLATLFLGAVATLGQRLVERL